MKTMRFCSVLAAMLLGGLLLNTPAHAQYTADYQTNIISGVTSNWSGDYIVGSNTYADGLLIQSGGVLSDGLGNIGYVGNNNAATVSGSGSVWSNSGDLTVGYEGSGNSLTISNGGAVYDNTGQIGSHNVVIVSGNGSVWSNSDGLSFVNAYEDEGSGSLIVSHGGAVYSSGSGGYNANVVVTGVGSVWNNYGDFEEGYPYGASGFITVTNGGAVHDIGAIFASALVTGSGSVWSNSGSLGLASVLTIADGGALYSSGFFLSSEGDVEVVVTDPGSVWNNTGSLDGFGYGFDLTITNGGAVYSGDTVLQDLDGAFALVSGAKSIWSIKGSLDLAWPSGLTIADDGAVVADSVYHELGEINVAGGGLYVTNGLGTGVLQLSGSTLALNNGTVTVDSVVVYNSPFYQYTATGVVAFTSGLLTSGGTVVSNGQNFAVGDGTDRAVFALVRGVHSFADGLEIESRALLTGCGTIKGSVVVDHGGTVLAKRDERLNFTGSVTNNGIIHVRDGATLNFYGPVVNNGLIEARKGHLRFWSSIQNNGKILTRRRAGRR